MLTDEQKKAAALLDGIKMNERPYFQNGDTLYLSCRGKDGDYYFVHWSSEKPVFESHVGIYTPRKLQMKDGAPVDVVGIPDKESVQTAPILSASNLYEALEAHINKYIEAPDLDRELFIYFALFTWFFPKVNTSPYLRFIADTGNGKSRMQRVIGDLCFYPIKAGGASTPAGIMRLKEKWNGTLLIDEADLKESTTTNELIKYLNLGFERGQYFIKSDKDDPKQQDIFDPFCPKLIGMRQPFQDNATEGRLLSFTPKELTRKDIPIILPASYDDEVRGLRAKIAVFILANWRNVDGEKMIDIKDLPIEPRLKQLALPLSIILQLFPDGGDRFKNYLTKRQQELKMVRAASLEGVVFNHVMDWTKDQRDTKGHLTARDIFEECGLKSANYATRILHSIGFETDVIKDDGKTMRVLVVPDEQTWKSICQRYFVDDAQGDPVIPPELKSKKWVTQVTQVTLTVDGQEQKVTQVTDFKGELETKKNNTVDTGCPSTVNVTSVTSVTKTGARP